MSSPEFVHLHVHTEYSLLDGFCRMGPMLARAREHGAKAIAMTDHGYMYGAVEFFKAAKKAELKPIFGVEAYLAPGRRDQKSGRVDSAYYHVLLLAKDLTGYRNLMKILSIASIEGFYYRPRADRETLAKHAEGVIATSGCLRGEIPCALSKNDWDGARKIARDYIDMFGRENFYIELMDHGIQEQIGMNTMLIDLAREMDLEIVASNDVHYLDAADCIPHDVLLCIQMGKTLTDTNRLKFGSDQFYLKSPQEMEAVWRHYPKALSNSLAIAEKCNVELDLKTFHLPAFPVDQEKYPGMDEAAFLEKLCYDNLPRCYGENPPEAVHERLTYELGVIKQMGFPAYFLIVCDFINYAKSNGIPVGPGRGSAAGSLVAYLTGITELDPFRHGLIFERFLNPSRKEMPDVDTDFCVERRGEVIEYVRRKYGDDRVCQIVTFGRLKARASIRDVGRVLDFPLGFVDKVAKMVPAGPKVTLKSALDESPDFARLYNENPDARKIIDLARSLEGVPRNASIHAAGVIISKESLSNHVPLQKMNDKDIVAQFEMGPVGEIGLVKMDFLGLRNLTVIETCLKIIKKRHGLDINVRTLPEDDAKVFELLQAADTTGVFQFESSGMRRYLKQLKPDRFADIVAMVALYRPGPIQGGMVEKYIDRRHGREAVDYPHPSLEPILKETYGIILYQEQVMQIANVMGGYSMALADELRKAMGKKKADLMEKHRQIFREGAVAKGIKQDLAVYVFDLMETFAGYGFNKCMTADTAVEMADGTRKPITAVRPGDLVLTKEGPYATLGVTPSGRRRVVKVRAANGMQIRCTPDHPVFTQRGWVNVEDVQAEDRIAVSRRLPCGLTRVPDHYPALLGYALSEGCMRYDAHFYLYSNDSDELSDMASILSAHPNTCPRVDDRRASGKGASVFPRRIDATRPSTAVQFLFDDCNLQNAIATDKFIPEIVDGWDERAIAILTAKLLQGDGCVHTQTRSIYYATSSSRLAFDIQRLFLKLSIESTIHRKSFAYRGGTRTGYTVNVLGGGNAFRLLWRVVGPHLVGRKQLALRDLAALYVDMPALYARGTVDVIPAPVAVEAMRTAVLRRFASLKQGSRFIGMSERNLWSCTKRKGIRRDTVRFVGEKLADEELLALASAPIAWSRVVSIEPDGEEETYDIAVPGPQSFIANGIVVHNSHSAAYAYVTYHTAWLKAHYPWEYMSALMTSVMDKIDKVSFFVAECRTRGIPVLPPDVNSSEAPFTVVDEGVRFGMGAVRNVGLGAIEAIVKAREESGLFTSLYDFCRRVDLGQVNKRVVESLIKSGAMDCFGLTRSTLLANLDQCLDAAQRSQREQSSGQISLFAGLGESPEDVAGIEFIDQPEFDKPILLSMEKDMLGLYLSDSPLGAYKDVIEAGPFTTIRQFDEIGSGNRVLIAGVITSVRTIITKTKQSMAFIQLEDPTGNVEVTALPRAYESSRGAIVDDAMVAVKGLLEARQGGGRDDDEEGDLPTEELKVLADEIVFLDGLTADAARRLLEKPVEQPKSRWPRRDRPQQEAPKSTYKPPPGSSATEDWASRADDRLDGDAAPPPSKSDDDAPPWDEPPSSGGDDGPSDADLNAVFVTRPSGPAPSNGARSGAPANGAPTQNPPRPAQPQRKPSPPKPKAPPKPPEPREPPPAATFILPVFDAPVHIRVEADHRDKMMQLREIIQRFPGPSSVYLHLESHGKSTVMTLDDHFTVRPVDELMAAVQDLLGDGSVWKDNGR